MTTHFLFPAHPLKATAVEEMFAYTSTPWARWQVIDGNNKKAARIAALTAVAEALEAAVPMTPPEAAPEVEAAARKAFGQ